MFYNIVSDIGRIVQQQNLNFSGFIFFQVGTQVEQVVSEFVGGRDK